MFKKLLRYILFALPLAFALHYIIEHKIMVLFWSYIALMGISSFLVRWFNNPKSPPRWLQILRHIVFVSFLAMLFWYCFASLNG